VAKQTFHVLFESELFRTETTLPSLKFYSNADIAVLGHLLKDFAEDITVENKDF
jgi:hypothetical protein